MSRGYRSSGWSNLSLRFVGSLVVFAIAALSGAVIGGVSVYIINDAINAPPLAQASADGSAPSALKQAKAQENKSAAAAPVQSQSPPKPAATPAASQAMPQTDSHAVAQDVPKKDAATQSAARQDAATQDAAQQAGQKPGPDALSRAHSTEASAPAVDGAPDAAAPAEARASDEANTKSGPAHAATDNQMDIAHKKAAAVARKRAAVTSARRYAPDASDQAQSAPQRAYYDYYNRDDPRAQGSFSQTRQRIIVRRQDNSNYGWDDRSEEAGRAVLPAQPRPSFFGLFGRDRYNNRDDHW